MTVKFLLLVGFNDVDGDCVWTVLSTICEGIALGTPLDADSVVDCSDGLLVGLWATVGLDDANFAIGNNDGYVEGWEFYNVIERVKRNQQGEGIRSNTKL